MEYLDPWWSTDDLEPDVRAAFLEQLRIEVGHGHAIYEVPARILARGDGDDVLFELLDGTPRVAVVRLTWSSSPEIPPAPETTIYDDLQTFVDQRMLYDHDLWCAIDDEDVVD